MDFIMDTRDLGAGSCILPIKMMLNKATHLQLLLNNVLKKFNPPIKMSEYFAEKLILSQILFLCTIIVR